MSESMTNGQLMSTLAGAASAFVAILAGFYTTKIFTLSTERNRYQNKINELQLELLHRKNNAKDLETQIDKIQDEKDEDKINFFVEHLGTAISRYGKPVNSYEDIIEMWKKYWESESEPSEAILKKLKDRSGSLIERLKPKEVKTAKYEPWKERESFLVSSIRDDATRMIEHDYELEENKKFEKLKTDFHNEQKEINYLEKQLDLATKELQSITYPKYLLFGFSSFVSFAILGVIIPLTNHLWDSYINEYLDPDLFAIILFVIGLVVTFIYIGIEVFSIFFHKKEQSQKEF